MAYLFYTDRPPATSFFMVRGVRFADLLIFNVRQAIWKLAPEMTIARVKKRDSDMIANFRTAGFLHAGRFA